MSSTDAFVVLNLMHLITCPRHIKCTSKIKSHSRQHFPSNEHPHQYYGDSDQEVILRLHICTYYSFLLQVVNFSSVRFRLFSHITHSVADSLHQKGNATIQKIDTVSDTISHHNCNELITQNLYLMYTNLSQQS